MDGVSLSKGTKMGSCCGRPPYDPYVVPGIVGREQRAAEGQQRSVTQDLNYRHKASF